MSRAFPTTLAVVPFQEDHICHFRKLPPVVDCLLSIQPTVSSELATGSIDKLMAPPRDTTLLNNFPGSGGTGSLSMEGKTAATGGAGRRLDDCEAPTAAPATIDVTFPPQTDPAEAANATRAAILSNSDVDSEKVNIILKDTSLIGFNSSNSSGVEQLFTNICEGTLKCQKNCTAGCVNGRRLSRDVSSGTSRRLSEACLESIETTYQVMRTYTHEVVGGASSASIATVGGNCSEVMYTYLHISILVHACMGTRVHACR